MNNKASFGGGIENGGTLTVTNITFVSNKATYGGGIDNSLALSLTNSTFASNTASTGTGVYNTNALTMTNTIIASSAGHDCVNDGTILSGTHNLIKSTGANACNLTNGAKGNLIGVDPMLGPLALNGNGGATLTLAPLPGSPAINTGDNAECPAFDQRGAPRPLGGTCDIGAVESLIWPWAYLPLALK